MNVLLFGAAGMLGHKICQQLHTSHEVYGTLRGDASEIQPYSLLDPERVFGRIEAENIDGVARTIDTASPDVVINAIGVVKQTRTGSEWSSAIPVNSIFPHNLAMLTRAAGTRLITISTDCVFSGRKGNYQESDVPDADNVYGVSKRLGEPSGSNVLVLRTSIVGRELRSTQGVVEWFLRHRGGTVQGFVNAIFSGLTTIALAKLIQDLIEDHSELYGLYHVSSTPISKHDLLVGLNTAFATKTTIERSYDLKIDRSLDSSAFRAITGWQPPEWDEMIAELSVDPTPYETWRHG